MAFIEWQLFHDMKTNLAVYEKLLVHFIDTESWWNLKKGSFSTIRKRTWLFTKSSCSI
jgi:hypothetical protein